MKSTLTCLLGLIVLLAGIYAWPSMDEKPKTSQEQFVPMSTIHSVGRERVSKEKTEPVKVEFGLRASFDPKPDITNQ